MRSRDIGVSDSIENYSARKNHSVDTWRLDMTSIPNTPIDITLNWLSVDGAAGRSARLSEYEPPVPSLPVALARCAARASQADDAESDAVAAATFR